MVAGCTSEPDDVPASVHESVCRGWQPPDNYYPQDSGGFTAQNLREIHDLDAEYSNSIALDGLSAAYFEFWRESVSKPPITPPLDVLCLVIEMESETRAREWLADAATVPAHLLGVYRPPDSASVHVEVDGSSARLSIIEGDSADDEVILAIGRAEVTGDTVQVVIAGSTEELSDVSAAEQLLAAIFAGDGGAQPRS